jgi:CDP-4-dehydro-6-deoxyglucose reductase, E1
MTYSLASNTWGKEEIEAIQKVIKSGRYTMGPFVKQYEKEFSDYFGCFDAVMVNSGSSANLLAIALLSVKYGLVGDIIVPAVSWSTTFFPLHQYGFKLNFVDIDKNTLNIDVNKIEKAITPNTSAIFAVNLLGNSNDFNKLKQICDKHKLILIEDNCESLGAKFENKHTGTIGKLGTFSFFFSHHLQTMEGGMIAVQNKDDADFLRSLRAHGWVRDLPNENSIYNKTGDNFKDSFTFVTPGYCVRPLEMSGAIGSAQLKKWPSMREKRLKNAQYFKERFEDLRGIRIQKEIGESSWFGFSIVLEGHLEGRRDQIIKILTENKVETRPIVAGNFMKNPVIKYINYIDNYDYENADYIHSNGFFIGNDITDLKNNIDNVYNLIKGIT